MPKPGVIIEKAEAEEQAEDEFALVPLSLQEYETETWRLKRVKLHWPSSSPSMNVPALVYGCFMLYDYAELHRLQNVKVKYRFQVGRSPDNLRICAMNDIKDLMKVIEVLHDEFVLLWREEDKREIVRKLRAEAEWVEPWMKTCIEDNKFYDPAPLKGG